MEHEHRSTQTAATELRPRELVLLGPLDPVVRAGCIDALRARFDVVEVSGSIAEIFRLCAPAEVAAIVVARRDAADADPIETPAVLIGLSGHTRDVLVVDDVHGARHLDNPTPEAICDFIGLRGR